ncbi:MAG: F0F1 ATP synthase subunit B [Bacilli bacterium]|nr:F0F1 ATP synthase subunit B [Bacilli bacterium]
MTLSVADKISEIINDGLELILNPPGGFVSVIIQLIATLILFLAVRFLLWDKITAVLEERKQKMDDAYKAKEDALKASEELAQQMIKEEKEAREKGQLIIERAKQKSYVEAEEIIDKAKTDAKLRLEQATEEITMQRANAEEQIKKEIVDVAYLMAEKIVEKEIDKSKYDNVVENFREKMEKTHD